MGVKPVSISVVGTSSIVPGLVQLMTNQENLYLHKILTSPGKDKSYSLPKKLLTQSLSELLEETDILIECSGDVAYGTRVIEEAFKAKKPVISMNPALQVTTGSYLMKKGYLTEAEGSRAGSLAQLKENAIGMGFTPVVYGLINSPHVGEPRNHGVSSEITDLIKDDTELQMEQALIANGLDASVGMERLDCSDVYKGARFLAQKAVDKRMVVNGHLRCPKNSAGVFVTATHDTAKKELIHLQMGEGPFYTFLKPCPLYHLEIFKTIRRIITGEKPLLNNSLSPYISVAAIAKKKLKIGENINEGIGSHQVRGECVQMIERPDHVPMGLMQSVVIKRSVQPDEMLTFDDIEFRDTHAAKIWMKTLMVSGRENRMKSWSIKTNSRSTRS